MPVRMCSEALDERPIDPCSRLVAHLLRRGRRRESIVAALAREPSIGPVRAPEVYDAVVADLLEQGLAELVPPVFPELATLVARAAPRVYPWYDAVWLGRWMGARDLAVREHPDLEAELVDRAVPLRTSAAFGTRLADDVIDRGVLAELRDVVGRLDARTVEAHERDRFGRTLVHDHPVLNEIQDSLVGGVSELAGEELDVSYNFLSLYVGQGVCLPHMDAPSAKYTLDVCVDQSGPWPIHISQVVPWPENFVDVGQDWVRDVQEAENLEFTSFELEPGQAIFFSGSSQWHYRELHPDPDAGFCTLVFFHFVPKGTHDFVFLFDG